MKQGKGYLYYPSHFWKSSITALPPSMCTEQDSNIYVSHSLHTPNFNTNENAFPI